MAASSNHATTNRPSLVTLQSHVLAEERRHPGATGTLSWILSAMAISTKAISAKLRNARLEDVLGDVGNQNVQGEQQQKLDVIANDILIQILRGRDGVAAIGSEEDDELIHVDANHDGGTRYTIMFDPLDGSSNLDTAGGVGTIFSVLRSDGGDALKKGREQRAAGYVLYGSSTVMVLTTGSGVHMFVLDPQLGAFIRVMGDMKIPRRGNTYSINESNYEHLPAGFQAYVRQCRERGYSSRYAGAMVADVHRVLLKGGTFMYPPTAKAPGGKLRLMYECNPMAMLVEAAGGKASTGTMDILDVQPETLHQRVPVVLGSPDDVDDCLALLG